MKRGPFSQIARKVLREILRRCFGYAPYSANALAEDIVDDLRWGGTTLRQKIWTYRRGFLSRRVHDYGLNEANVKDYQNDLLYYRLFQLNEYSDFIDDKLKLRYVLQPFAEYFPRYYFSLRGRRPARLTDCPARLSDAMPSVLEVLRHEKELAAKMVGGEGGAGFYKLSFGLNRYQVNDTPMGEQELVAFLSTLKNYIITEHIVSHPFIRQIYSATPNSLRVMAMHIPGEEPMVAGAFFRFGTLASGKVDNVSAGGMICGVDITDGRLYGAKIYKDWRWVGVEEHIDSHVRIEGHLPHWGLVMGKVLDMCRYWPGLKHVGFDIIITEQSFKCIEINSQPCINTPQLYYPFMKNDYAVRLYAAVEKNKRR